MIGVAVREGELEWVREFFELFKTPWEPVAPGKHYDVVLVATGDVETCNADVLLVYGSEELEIDRRCGAIVTQSEGPLVARWKDDTLALYGRSATFSGHMQRGVLFAGSATAGYHTDCGRRRVYRMGYDLFHEIRHLLTRGQARAHAETPTLELHIDVIRGCLEESGVAYLEIPARPYQAPFICCLTHDIDFFGIRRHGLGRTLAGFMARGTVGTLVDVLLGRRRLGEACRNWLAVLSLPFVFLGIRRDFWQPFDDYLRADAGRRSTFFLIPFKGRAGVGPDGVTRAHRASPYGVQEIRIEIDAARGRSVEFAVHGIDAWRDSAAGVAELAEVAAATGKRPAGVRMHWLYFSDDSPRAIESAGYTYDSSWGYNDAVGFRAGTSQAFQLAGTHLLELPLTIMDTALFYPDRMGLDAQEGMRRCSRILGHALRFGGAVVVNWHDRSLAPERQWQRSYQELLSGVPESAWFATTGEAAEWFRWRRAIRFVVDEPSRTVRVEAPPRSTELPTGTIVVRRRIDRNTTTAEELAIGEQPCAVSV
jgi:hypothetical protein